MSTEPAVRPGGPLTIRADRETAPRPAAPAFSSRPARLACLALLASAFVLLGGASLDPGPIEARLGLAAFEAFGPLGQVFGGWEPSVWPAQLLPSWLWAWGEGGTPTVNSVRWPAAIAGVALGLLLARRASERAGGGAGVLVGLAWYGSLALMDRSAGAGLDLITALGTVAALDRLLDRGADLKAGLWAALAFAAGGWPPVVVVALATVVLGRRGTALGWRLLLPPALAALAWSAWALAVAPPEAWGAAVALPLTQKPALLLVPGVLALGLPWSPFAAFAAARSVRDGLEPRGRDLLTGWAQIAGACLLAGTLVPGLALAAKVPALAALAVVAGLALHRLLDAPASSKALRLYLRTALGLACLWLLVTASAGGYLAAAVSCYRPLAVTLIALAVPTAALAAYALGRRDPRAGLLTLLLLALFLKAGHWGYYVPEWNYRRSQGPWGRAIGQWVPPGWPVYTTHAWNADLGFAIGRPVRQLPSERHLAYQPGEAKFVLLLGREFENWPDQAPPLERVAAFRDEFDETRILARTSGPLPWHRIASGPAPTASR